MVRRFLPYLRPVAPALGAGVLASVMQAAMQWLEPWPLKMIFDSVIGHQPLPAALRFLPALAQPRLNALVAAMLGITLLLGLFSFLATRLVAQAGQRVVFDIRRDLFVHLESQSLGFHQRRTTGDLLARVGGDAQALQGMVVNAVPTLVNSVLTLSGMLVIMLLVDWHFTLLALSLMPFLYLAARYFLGNIKASQRRARRFEGEANAVAQEVLSSVAAVQAFGRERHEAGRFTRAMAEGLDASQHAVTLQAGFTPTTTGMLGVATALVIWFGASAVLGGHLTPGDLLVFMAYLRGMYSPVRQLAKLANVVSRGQAAAERIVEVLDTHEQVPERPGARPPVDTRGDLRVQDVEFAYPDGSLALSAIDLRIPAGARVAVVGASGSGKSTLLRLFPRFFDPSAGSVSLDGVDVRDLTLAGLRQQIALVPQEPYIFRATVWENIAYGKDNISREAAIAAARAAGVHDVLAGLSRGYDTVIAERGASLSGGQRQCIALARALARNPRVLLLDEPTTGLDTEARALLLSALDRLGNGRTIIMVTHDLTAIRGMDLLVVIASGRLVRVGAIDDLLDVGAAQPRLGTLLGEHAAVPTAFHRATVNA
ncbi:MAG TPA: ABC transporter ATP-binding protein [Thermomicrobiaceae bacterium]|nr:ABC transporter ATP-binding protein [Thermomicrobiaceae bacterium]